MAHGYPGVNVPDHVEEEPEEEPEDACLDTVHLYLRLVTVTIPVMVSLYITNSD